ncbi:pyridoxamine 5'-phosphate oxidase family protein [Marinomonas mediterranea]|jgi:Predicted flavin-nucleotide-binding protein structurally related to pyridoxine 5''-phosphate oxidase|uniref:pyridoxamine 5'-phosphate oxidase family protein n=1 Tax=Marinomonas mediterranea TaxID=119864 RepID=UPI000319D060
MLRVVKICLPSEVKNSLNESVLCWLSTLGADGNPNCSPKKNFTFVDDLHIVIADIASSSSRKNVLDNPLVCVSFVHVLKQKGFKVKGAAHYI